MKKSIGDNMIPKSWGLGGGLELIKKAGYDGIELWLGAPVTRLAPHGGPRSRHVELADGRRLPYDKLLIATGAAPRQLAVPGADLPGILYLRTLRDSGMRDLNAEQIAKLKMHGVE